MASAERRSARTRRRIDYSSLHDGVVSLAVDSFRERLATKHFCKPHAAHTAPEVAARFPVFATGDDWLAGRPLARRSNDGDDEVTLDVKEHCAPAYNACPVLIRNPEGLDMEMPTRDTLTVENIRDWCGADRMLSAMDVATQRERRLSLRDWVGYFNTPAEQRSEVLNVLSLEVTDTPLGDLVRRPLPIRNHDWVSWAWPKFLTRRGIYPKVQVYCLMSVANSYTDFHVDFAGTSVFYHVVRGTKMFYFIEPTSRNLREFESWSRDTNQNSVFFPDELPGGCAKNCYKFVLHEGDTMLIPSGWMHAVLTPEDSLVIGGNYLHNDAIPMQLKIQQLEEDTEVQKRFRYPYFAQLCWYVAKEVALRSFELYNSRNSQQLAKYNDNNNEMNRNPDLRHLPTQEQLRSLVSFLKANMKKRGRKSSSIPPRWKDIHTLLETLELLCMPRHENNNTAHFISDATSNQTDLTSSGSSTCGPVPSLSTKRPSDVDIDMQPIQKVAKREEENVVEDNNDSSGDNELFVPNMLSKSSLSSSPSSQLSCDLNKYNSDDDSLEHKTDLNFEGAFNQLKTRGKFGPWKGWEQEESYYLAKERAYSMELSALPTNVLVGVETTSEIS